jgi:hypothetical protein
MFAEEQFLRKKFGNVFIEWAEKTPAFFPKCSLYVKTDLKFSIRNVLKREYNGFFGLVFTMTLFRIIGFTIVKKQFYLDKPWIFICSIAFIIFISLKILKKFTHVLNVNGR